MENTNETEQLTQEQQQEGYVSRPAWQVWGARIGLVLFLLLVAMQVLSIAREAGNADPGHRPRLRHHRLRPD